MSQAQPPVARLVRGATLSTVAEYAYGAVVPATALAVFVAGACPLDATVTPTSVLGGSCGGSASR